MKGIIVEKMKLKDHISSVITFKFQNKLEKRNSNTLKPLNP